jgi:hypothetical protein
LILIDMPLMLITSSQYPRINWTWPRPEIWNQSRRVIIRPWLSEINWTVIQVGFLFYYLEKRNIYLTRNKLLKSHIFFREIYFVTWLYLK